jgi:hypothetical protein
MVKTIHDEMRDAHERLRAMVETARKEDRDFTDAERVESEALQARMTALDTKRKRDDGWTELLRSFEAMVPAGKRPTSGENGEGPSGGLHLGAGFAGPYLFGRQPTKTLGQQFIEHEVYNQIRAMPKGGNWSSPPFELNAAVTIDPLPTPPAGAYPAGLQLQPFLTTPLDWYISSLFAQGTLSGSLIQYLREKVWTNAAAPVGVGGTKPESTLTFEAVNQALTKIAHWIPVPDEFLDDIEGLRSYIDARMAQGVLDKLEDQVINGDGLGGNMLGVLATPGLTAPMAHTGAGPYAATIAAQRAAIYAASRLRPDAVAMSPATWALVSTETAAGAGFIAGTGAFTGALAPQVAGLRVVESPSLADGVALIGAFKQGGQLWRKGGVTVQATNSHADLFIKNTTAIRAEIRAALTVYRPAAFGTVTGLEVAGP